MKTSPSQQTALGDWWPEFSEYFERKEGFTPHPRDSDHKRAFEYFVEGAFQQFQKVNDWKE